MAVGERALTRCCVGLDRWDSEASEPRFSFCLGMFSCGIITHKMLVSQSQLHFC